MKYKITVTDGRGTSREFVSKRRNAKQHLRNEFGAQDGARCIVRTMSGEVVSACEYSDEIGYYYIIWFDDNLGGGNHD